MSIIDRPCKADSLLINIIAKVTLTHNVHHVVFTLQKQLMHGTPQFKVNICTHVIVELLKLQTNTLKFDPPDE